MNYTKVLPFDTVNGPGVRVTLFVSGCTLNCIGCFNKEAQNFKAGSLYTHETINTILKHLDNDFVDGLSILGGEPTEKQNYHHVLALCKEVKMRYPKKTIWLWSGRTMPTIAALGYNELLKYIDVLVDGPFEQDKYQSDLEWRGSSNQRIIKLT